MGEKITIRRLEKDDFSKGFLESLANLGFPIGLSADEARDIFTRIDSNPFYRIFVAELEGEIVGVATLLIEQKFFLKGTKFGYLEDMSVRKGFERKGIGARLVDAVIKEADAEGCLCIRLDCNDHTAPFYEKSGFKKKPRVNRMQLNLRFVSSDE